MCSLRYCLKFYFSKGVYSFTLSTVYVYTLFVPCFELRELGKLRCMFFFCVLFWLGNLEGTLKPVIYVCYFGLVHS